MRVIAGTYRGRTLKAPPGDATRPTSDRVREALFSILATRTPGARVLDLFAGSGALGLEAVSRGAAEADLVESAAPSLKSIAANIAALDAAATVRVHRADALKFAQSLPSAAYDVAFADPPYDLGLAAQVAERWLATPFAALLGVEHRAFEPMPGGGETRRYGDTAITFYGMSG
jgi:16S rRNA (guanine966-N2)-methyltransferase